MSELGDKLRQMADEVTRSMLGAAEDADKGRINWAEVALDEAATMFGKMQELVEESFDE